jgi:hypothetical protein
MAEIKPPYLPSMGVSTDQVEPVITPNAPTVEVPVVAAPAKPISKSSTMWFNGAVGAVGVVVSILAVMEPQISENIRKAFPNEELGLSAVAVFTSLVAFVNLALRFWRTSQPIQK